MKISFLTTLLCIAAAYLFIVLSSAQAGEVQCDDIRNVDFKNMDIDPHGSKPEQQFSFRNGKAQEIIEDEPEIRKQVEWEATIEKEMSVKPSHDTLIRFIYIFNNHIGGTGTRSYLVGFGCFDGTLHQVFEQDGFTLNINKMNHDALIVSTHPGYREPFTKHFSYRWNPQTSLYVLRSTHMTHDDEE